MNIPFYSELKSLVKDGGFEAYLVGGCVRDVLLGRTVSDIDLVCMSHDYHEFAKAVRVLLPSSWVEFKDNVRLVCPYLDIDVSKPRGATIQEDLLKRDFTINNLAMDFDGNILGDRTDIDRKVIRHVAEETFFDDPLRMLRAFRFCAQLGFKIDAETMLKIKSEKYAISESANERVLQELFKLFKGGFADNAIYLMHECRLYQLIFDNYPYSCMLVEAAKSGRGLEFFMSAMFFEETGAKHLLSRLCFSNASARKIMRTAEAAHFLKNLYGSADPFELRKFAYCYADELDEVLPLFEVYALCNGIEAWDSESFMYNVMLEVKNVDFESPMRLNGGFLMGLGISAGKLMGEIINDVRPLLASREIEGIEAAEEYIRLKYLGE